MTRKMPFPAVAMLMVWVAPAGAQHELSGTVRDTRGVPLAAAAVVASNNATGISSRASTSPDGRYTISGLTAGTYDVSVSRIGYEQARRTGVVPREAPLDFTMEQLSFALHSVRVTALLRDQELADVPFSIAAPTARVLRERGAETLEDIALNVAGFSVQNLGPGQSQVAVRGASAGQITRDQPGVKEQVGIYLDGVPVSLSLFTPDLDLFDISRVEVLRGPQGTLFGSGSMGGTVRYISNAPELGRSATFAELGANVIDGGGPGGSLKAGVNVPITSRSAGRFTAYHSRIGGFMDAVQPDFTVKKDVNGGARTGARAAILVAPTPRLSISPRITFQRVRMDGWNRIDAYNILANPFTTAQSPSVRPPVDLGLRHFAQVDEPFTDDFTLGDLNLRYDIGPARLTSIGSYASREILVVRDATALTASITGGGVGLPENIYTLDAPLSDATKVRVVTQELRLAGASPRTNWLLGTFFTSNRREYGQSLLVSGFEAGTGIETGGLRAKTDELFFSELAYDLTQIAVFGEATATLTARLAVTGGLRYYRFDEDRRQIFDGLFANEDTGNTLVSVPGSIRTDGLAPRAVAVFRVSDGLSLNAQASRGFRLGGINDPLNVPLCTAQDLITFGGRDTWGDETAWNYEMGAKAITLGERAFLNLSAFHMDIRDLQVVVTAGSCSSRLVFNVPRARSHGFEAELFFKPNRFFDLSVSGSYNEATLLSTLTETDETGSTRVVAGIEAGNRLPSVPRVQLAAAGTYRVTVGRQSVASITSTFQHVGSRLTQVDDHGFGIGPSCAGERFGCLDLNTFGGNTIGRPLTASLFRFSPRLPAYNLANVRIGVSRPGWELTLYVNNVTDERALLALDRERGARARVGYLRNQPRTFGTSLRVER